MRIQDLSDFNQVQEAGLAKLLPSQPRAQVPISKRCLVSASPESELAHFFWRVCRPIRPCSDRNPAQIRNLSRAGS